MEKKKKTYNTQKNKAIKLHMTMAFSSGYVNDKMKQFD